MRDMLAKVFENFFILPLGARAKPLEPDAARPTDDHTRTGLNAATEMYLSEHVSLHHTLDAAEVIARRLLFGHSMAMTDVEAAFPMLPPAVGCPLLRYR